MKKMTTFFSLLLMVFCLAIPVSAEDEDAIKKHPGYVNFDEIQIPADAEETVEVYVKGPLLKLVAAATEAEDPALSHMLEDLFMIRVNTFSINSAMAEDLISKVKKIEKQLEQQKWEKLVRVNSKEEHVNIYLKYTDQQQIAGLVVMAIENDDEAVFVNIVGGLDLKLISKLGKKFDIDELNEISDEDKTNK